MRDPIYPRPIRLRRIRLLPPLDPRCILRVVERFRWLALLAFPVSIYFHTTAKELLTTVKAGAILITWTVDDGSTERAQIKMRHNKNKAGHEKRQRL